MVVVCGGQFGGEGKGKFAAYLSLVENAKLAVRVGGPNSGRRFYYNGQTIVLRCIPAGVVNPRTRLLLAPGTYIDLSVLHDEIERYNIKPERLGIDRNAVIIEPEYRLLEKEIGLDALCSSTLSGTGYAVAMKALRIAKLAKDVKELKPFITDVSEEVNNAVDKGENVIIEGTQGIGLSVHHSPYYPYTTSRDTSCSGIISEVGLSPKVVDYIVLCVRTFPIRVEGNSGPLPREITWEDVRVRSKYPYEIVERTSATNRARRVAEFDEEIVKRAVMINRPDYIAVHGIDYLNYNNRGRTRIDELDENALVFLKRLEEITNTCIGLISTGPAVDQIIDMRNKQVRIDEWINMLTK